jgi:hypothetical protein
MEAIHTSTHDDNNGIASDSSNKISGKTGNETRQVRTHTWAPNTSPKLKSLQDLSIRVNPEVIEEVVHHAGLLVDGGLHRQLHMCKVIHLSLESSNPFHRMLGLVNPITDIRFKGAYQSRYPAEAEVPAWRLGSG